MLDEPRPLQSLTLPALVTALAVAVLAGFVTFGGLAQTMNLAWGLWTAEGLVFFGLPFVVVRRAGLLPLRLGGLDAGTPRGLGLGFAFGAINYFAWAVPLMALAQAFFPQRVVELFDSSAIFKHQTPVETVLLAVGVSVAAPLCEEFFFRGVLQPGLLEKLEPPTAVVVSAFVFAFFHLDPVGFLARFEMGVVFGLLAWRSGSLWPSIGAHAANNLVSTALFFAAGGDTEGDLAWWVPSLSFAVGNAGLALLVRLSAGKLESPRPAAIVEAPPPSWGRLVGPWLLGAAVLVGGLLAVDWRGVQLGFVDALVTLDRDARKDERLWALRDQARRGEIPLDEYRAYRTALSKRPEATPGAPDAGVR
ncbi:MAG: type II CAAX endopeptidase family protein [Myxococcota bacterium]